MDSSLFKSQSLGVGWDHNVGCQIYTYEEKEKNIQEKHSGKKVETCVKTQVGQIEVAQTMIPWKSGATTNAKELEKKILTNTKTTKRLCIYHENMWIKIDKIYFFCKIYCTYLTTYFEFDTVM